MAHLLADYGALLTAFTKLGYRFYPIREYFTQSITPPFIYLRHDVDRLPGRAVALAQIEAQFGIYASYYFRCTRFGKFPDLAMQKIAALGHEIGFHYENLSRAKGNITCALQSFARDLAACRQIAPIQTIAPHGAPFARAGNCELTSNFSLQQHNLVGDATALDFTEILYITDTGGTFGSNYNRRDRPTEHRLKTQVHPRSLANYCWINGEQRLVLNCHPERWPASFLGLLQASAFDYTVNLAKLILLN